jgi:hypothetical protein
LHSEKGNPAVADFYMTQSSLRSGNNNSISDLNSQENRDASIVITTEILQVIEVIEESHGDNMDGHCCASREADNDSFDHKSSTSSISWIDTDTASRGSGNSPIAKWSELKKIRAHRNAMCGSGGEVDDTESGGQYRSSTIHARDQSREGICIAAETNDGYGHQLQTRCEDEFQQVQATFETRPPAHLACLPPHLDPR